MREDSTQKWIETVWNELAASPGLGMEAIRNDNVAVVGECKNAHVYEGKAC